MVSIDGCKHLCILRDIDCPNRGAVNHQSKTVIYKMPEATRTCDYDVCVVVTYAAQIKSGL